MLLVPWYACGSGSTRYHSQREHIELRLLVILSMGKGCLGLMVSQKCWPFMGLYIHFKSTASGRGLSEGGCRET